MKKIYIHIGMHKTGTTSIQDFMFHNRVLLGEYGYVYPDAGAHESAQHGLATNLNKKAGLSINRHAQVPKSQRVKITDLDNWNRLKRMIDGSAQATVLSTENFEWLKDPAVIRNFLGEHEYKIIVYLRRQDKYLESLYQSYVKSTKIKLSVPFKKWIAKTLSRKIPIHDYGRLIQRWSDVFGTDAMIVRLFEDEIKTGLEKGFARAIGLTDEQFARCAIPPKSELQRVGRESVDGRCAEIVRGSNRSKLPPEERALVVSAAVAVSERLALKGKVNKNLMALPMRQKVLASVEASNRGVAQQYFGRDALFVSPVAEENASKQGIRSIIGAFSQELIKVSRIPGAGEKS